jgi:hypothetical protein
VKFCIVSREIFWNMCQIMWKQKRMMEGNNW